VGNKTDFSGPLDDNADLGDAAAGTNRRNRVSNAGPLDPDDPFEGRKRPKTAGNKPATNNAPRNPKGAPDPDVAKPPRGGNRR
jgi:hypothetical protein